MARKKIKSSRKNSVNHSTADTPEIKKFRALFNLMNECGVSEFEWHKGSEKIIARTGVRGSHQNQALQNQSFSTAMNMPNFSSAQTEKSVESLKETKPQAAPQNSKLKEVCSPLVGTFYASPSPQSDPYIKEGQKVSKGDILCIVEAMKLMNEIESEFSGKIVSILIENGQPVEYGEPLFLIDTSA